MLTFESTHEYYLGPNADIHYCSEHEALIVTRDYEDRVLINGISKETLLKFARKFYTDSLQDELTQEDKDALSKDVVKA